MDRRILIQVTAPAVVIGLLLFATCLVSAWIINRLQTNMTVFLSHNVASLEAAQDMQMAVRRMHFQGFLYLIEPDKKLLDEIDRLNKTFPDHLWRAEQAADTQQERDYVRQIKEGYARYHQAFQQLRNEVERNGPLRSNFRELADDNPIRRVLDSCEQLLQVNKSFMQQTTAESERISRTLRLVILLLGLGGPTSGLIIGASIARGLSKSIYKLSVRVQDMAQRLEPIDVGMLSVMPDGDIDRLDRQLEHVIGRVEEVARKMQRHQRDMLRAQQLAAVGQLAASVAHEVRNPLTAIKLLVEAARRPNKPRPFNEENLRIVHDEVLRLEKTVQGFLDFARPPAVVRQECDLREVVAQAVSLVQGRARQQGVAIKVQSLDTPLERSVDRDQLCTVLVNLLLNALDAMPTGGTLTIDYPASALMNPEMGQESWNKVASIRISDTGSGIPPEMVDRLFTPFASTKPTGTGLGLCLSRRIVEEHGGRISGSNRPDGRGACFQIDLF
jgi:signal transduction histidine kinase